MREVLWVVPLVLVFHSVNAQLSPCPNIFNYVKWDEPGKWHGQIKYSSTDDLIDGVFLVMTFDKASISVGSDFGKNVIKKSATEYLLRNLGFVLKANDVLTINFFIEFDSRQKPPILTGIRVNGRKICPSEHNNSGGYITSKPDYGAFYSSEQEQLELELKDHPQPLDPPRLTPTTPRPLEHFPSSPNQCGTVTARQVGLIASGGQEALPGEWPWHVSLIKFEGPRFNYLCGGTLIGPKHVLTAAHCITKPHSSSVQEPSKLTIFLGQPNLRYVNENQQQRDISEITIHPDFTQIGLKNDIAILKLTNDVKVTDYVKPICLWKEATNLETVINRLGTVVGWGGDENNAISSILRKAQIPVVAPSDCILSNVNFFSNVVWQKNFCAGFHNATSVCNGDSGGGMYFPLPGTKGPNTVWQLRGLVSLGFGSPNSKNVCDSNEYTVFTDVAQYLTWIEEVMKK